MPKQSSSSLLDSPFWGRGFRPFFMLGAIYTILSIGLWALFYAGLYTPPDFYLDPVSWHAHEMIFGFTMAIVAGFLLTAVANWSGGAPARQLHLASLCALWVAGRMVMNIDLGLPAFALILIEGAFIPALAVSLAIPLIKSWNKRNFVFLTLLSVLFVCDLWFLITLDMTALHVALMMILAMVSLIGGRIIPAFTVAALRRKGIEAYQTDQMKLDMAALLSLIAVTLCLVYAKDTIILSSCALASCLIHALRMRRYHTLKTFDDPLLWILHAGYMWLIIGLALLIFVGFGIVSLSSILHALTAGCIGSMILGMICRVTLGHTGRVLVVSKVTAITFVLIQMAAALRVFGPLIIPAQTITWILISAGLWVTCFALYLLFFCKILLTKRPDGAEA